jgi:hypothetical protein
MRIRFSSCLVPPLVFTAWQFGHSAIIWGGSSGPPRARLRDAAALPLVTLQVLPAVAHNANASGFIVADDATAYAEHVAGGYVFTDEQTGTSLAIRFDSLRGECMKVSESPACRRRRQRAGTGAA